MITSNYKFSRPIKHCKATAAFFLLGDLLAPLSHVAFVAQSDHYTMLGT